MTNTNKPLYKQLNEQRTQGELKIVTDVLNRTFLTDGKNGEVALFDAPKTGAVINTFSEEEIKANTQYIALAINNLHILAEALEKMCGNYHTIINVLENWNESRIDKPYTNILESMKLKLKNGEEALNRIS